MFFGTFKHILDAKNRLTLPTRLRNELKDEVIVSKGFDGCLELRTLEEFDFYSRKLTSLPVNHRDSRVVLRQVFANAARIRIDKANRILIPANLLMEANIKKEVSLIGVGKYIEIWDEDAYLKFKQDADATFESVAESLKND